MKKNILLSEKRERRVERLQLVFVLAVGFIIMAAGTFD